jgi:hypothetical protein
MISASFIGRDVRSRRVVEGAEGWLLEYARTRHRLTPIERTRGDEQVVWCEQVGEWSRWACRAFSVALSGHGTFAPPRTISAETSWLLATVRGRHGQTRERRATVDQVLTLTEQCVAASLDSAVCVAHVVAVRALARVAAQVSEGHHARA